MKLTKSKLRRIIKEELEFHAGSPDDPLDLASLTPDEAFGLGMHAAEYEAEGVEYGDGGEASMAKAQLFQIAKDAQSLHDRLNDGDKLPEWVQTKVAIMYAAMTAVSDHLDYKMHTGGVTK